MGRAEAGTAKYQSKILKAAGLQKLKYYCQICQKQCRDANGFKLHLGSPSHMGRISNLSKDGKGASVVLEYLAQFEREFLRLLRVNHGTKKVDANKFYQEYILNDLDHLHMNATRWSSLTAFVKHLGRLGKVSVESDESAEAFNLTILYVDSFLQAMASKRVQQMRTDEEVLMKFITAQVEAGKKLQKEYATGREYEKGRERRGEDAEPELVSEKPSAPAKVALSLKGLKPKKTNVASVFGPQSDEE